MFSLSTTVTDNRKQVAAATERAQFKNFRHAAARISKDAKASIITDEEPSEPGQPPHTKSRPGRNLRGAIRFDATKDDALVGPMADYVGDVGKAHEKGGEFRGGSFEERPFMQPALEKNVDRFAQQWAGSIQ